MSELTGPYSQSLETRPFLFAETIASSSLSSGSTKKSLISAAFSLARRGDFVQFTSGVNNDIEVAIDSVSGTTATLNISLISTPSAGDAFLLLRYQNCRIDSNGNLQVITTSSSVITVEPTYTESTSVDDTSPGFLVGSRDIAGNTWVALKSVKGGADIDSTTMQMCTAGATYGWTGTKFSPIFTGATGRELQVEVTNTSFITTGNTFSSATTATLGVTTSSQTALAAFGTRKFAIFQNDSDTTIYLKFGSGAVANSGIRLNANGGAYEINTNNLYTGIVTAIHGGTGTKTLLITSG